jgi:hypothetical protein
MDDDERILWVPPRRPAYMSQEKVLKDLLAKIDRHTGKEDASMD